MNSPQINKPCLLIPFNFQIILSNTRLRELTYVQSSTYEIIQEAIFPSSWCSPPPQSRDSWCHPFLKRPVPDKSESKNKEKNK